MNTETGRIYTTDDKKLYRKVGRHYQPVGYEFAGWPTDGVWLVQTTPGCVSSQAIMKIGDLLDPAPLAAFHRHKDAVTTALMRYCEEYSQKNPGRGPSFSEIVHFVYMSTCKEEEKQHGLKAPSTGTATWNGPPLAAYLDGRKGEILAENFKRLDSRAEAEYYHFRPDEEEHISWEMLTEEKRNQFRQRVQNRRR